MIRSNKQKLLDLVSRMPDDVSWEEVAQRLELLRQIEIARKQTAQPAEAVKELPASASTATPHSHFPGVT